MKRRAVIPFLFLLLVLLAWFSGMFAPFGVPDAHPQGGLGEVSDPTAPTASAEIPAWQMAALPGHEKRLPAANDLGVAAPLSALPLIPRDSVRLSPEAMAGWPGGRLLRAGESVTRADGSFRRVGIVQPADLPYPVRVEEWGYRESSGRESIRGRVEMVADRVLAAWDDTALTGQADFEALLAAHGAHPGEAVGHRARRLGVLSNDLDAIPQLLDAFARAGAPLRYAEPDYIVRTFAEPNDPRYLDGSLWGLRNTGVAGADVSAEAGWAIRREAAEVFVGIVDTGLRLTHEDLVANLWINPNESANGVDSDDNGYIDDLHGIDAINRSGNPFDEEGHGTHVGGTVGAVGNNGVGVTGIAWNVRLMGLRFIGSGGGGAVSDAIICIEYGVDHGVHILNNSWGSGGFSQALYDAVDYAREAGVIFVAAAGNASSNNDVAAVFPASLPLENIVTVASTDRRDELSGFSNLGEGTVDLAAPGSDILSVGVANDSAYRTSSGTSMAAPLVAGALALLRAEFPGESPGQLLNRLYRGADQIPALADGIVASGGRLNLAAALTAVSTPANDRFADARPVFADLVLLRGNNHGATAHPDDPVFGNDGPPNAVWFRYTAKAAGQTIVRISPEGSYYNPLQATTRAIKHDNIPSVYAVFTYDDEGELILVGEATDGEAVTFVALSRSEYFVGVAGQYGAEGLFMLDIAGPPRNGELANAQALDLSRTISGTNRNALPEPGEPAHAGQPATASVWYKWTASLSGRVAFTTRGSDFPTVAAVYSGPAANPSFALLRPEGSGIRVTGSTANRVTFQAVSGQTSYIAVDGLNGAEGAVAASIGVPPANDDFARSTVLQGTGIERTVTTNFASREEGEPIHFSGRGNGETIWFTWTAPENGRTTISAGTTFSPAIVAVYTGDRVDALTLVTSDFGENRRTQVVFEASEGNVYRIAVDSTDFSLINAPFVLSRVPVPPNETFAGATVLEGRNATIVGTNAGASREPGEPGNLHNNSASVWYRWTAPVSGEVGLYGERLDKPLLRSVVLTIFTGDALKSLTHVREDFGNGIGRDAFARWQAVAGQTYHFQVTSMDRSSISGAEGPFRLDLRPIAEHRTPNATFAQAIELDGSTVYNYRTHNYGLSPEFREPHHGGLSPNESLWWRFTAPASGRYAVSTAQSESAIITAVYRTTDPHNPAFGNLVPVANNYGSASMAFPDLAWNAVAGETYYIALERAAGSRGRVLFHFHRVPENIVHMRAATLEGHTATIITHNWGSVREPGEPLLGAPADRQGGALPLVAMDRARLRSLCGRYIRQPHGCPRRWYPAPRPHGIRICHAAWRVYLQFHQQPQPD